MVYLGQSYLFYLFVVFHFPLAFHNLSPSEEFSDTSFVFLSGLGPLFYLWGAVSIMHIPKIHCSSFADAVFLDLFILHP